MSLSNELEKLTVLHKQGAISTAQFEKAKEQLLAGKSSSANFDIGDALYCIVDPLKELIFIIGLLTTVFAVYYFFTGEDGGLLSSLSPHAQGQATLLLLGALFLFLLAPMTCIVLGIERGLFSSVATAFFGTLGGWGGYHYAKSLTEESLLHRITDWYASLISGQNFTINRIAWYVSLGAVLAVWISILGLSVISNLKKR